jgi:signal transduction histidine kinase
MGMRRRVTVAYADGTRGPVMVHTAPIRDSNGDVELVVEIGADIGEVRRLQERLQATQQRYQQLFDEAPCYITVQNPDLTIRAANRRFQEDFDLIVGSFCHKIYKDRNDACPDCPVAKTFIDGLSHQCEMEVTSKRGETYRVLIQTAPIRDLSGDITHVMEMSTNITRTRRLEDQLASLGLMIGSVSHGIKGLLTGLDGGMYLLDSGFKKENQQQIREGWDTVRFMVGRIRDMVLDILYYAKEKNLKWETVDVLGFAKEVLHTVGPKLIDHQITLKHRFDPNIGRFDVDAGVIRSALTNIIENAVEACQSDPSGRPHEIFLEVVQDANHIYFNVSDNGIGMDATTRANVFTPFFSSKGERGTGLGLFISNRILSQHGGGISLESEPEKGSRFSIKIPKKATSHPAGEQKTI